MTIKIENKEEKPLLARKEISGSITFEGKATPSNEEVAKAVASELKVDEKTVVMKHIYTAFGSSEAKFEALVYDSEEEKKKYEPMTKAMKEAAKKAEEDAKKAEEEAAAAKEAEAKAAEEKKEEAKEEKAEEKKE